MKWNLDRANLIRFLVLWSIVGFPLLALATSALGQSSTNFSIFFRTVAGIVALILLFRSARPSNIFAFWLFLMFWAVYFTRLLITTALEPEILSRPIEFYWTWGVGVCFLPSLVLFFALDSATIERLQFSLLPFFVLSAVLAFVFGGMNFAKADGTIVNIDRLNIESLNPISMGHLGVSSVLTGICVFRLGSRRLSIQALAFGAICLGGVLAILANSRGPFIAFLVCLGLLTLAGSPRKRNYIFGIVLFLATLIIGGTQRDFILGDTGVLWRFNAIVEGLDQSTTGRIIAFRGAFDQFLDSPIFGSSIEERSTGFYPHNLILEAFMATGVVGGLPYLAISIWAVCRTLTLINHGSRNAWVGVLAVQYIVGSMFSGAIYTSNTMWALVALVLSVPIIREQFPIGVSRRSMMPRVSSPR